MWEKKDMITLSQISTFEASPISSGEIRELTGVNVSRPFEIDHDKPALLALL